MRTRLKKRVIWIAVAIIAMLLAIQFVFSYQNSKTIDRNLDSRREAQAIKVNTLDIIRSLHELDIGLRGYALVPSEQLAEPFDIAHERIDSVLTKLESSLQNQDYDMTSFYQMKDSIRSYFRIADKMFGFLEQGRESEFLKFLEKDYGYNTWLQYLEFETHIISFENKIITNANENYQNALRRNYYTIVLLILLIVPTLSYTAYYSNMTYDISDKLIKTTEERNLLLANQNETLEKLVKERTDEIATQNEEIQANLDAISKRNNQLEEAKIIIEQKNQVIEDRNKGYGEEVEKQTYHLRQSNKELIRNVNQLEQFSYTVSHNLRAPVARLMGLAEIIKYSRNEAEKYDIQQKIYDSSLELDKILKDLVLTIEIKKEINNALVEVSLDQVISKTLTVFQEEIKLNGITVKVSTEVKKIKTITAYIESIFYNLVSNAIKYRSSNRPASIEISSHHRNDWIEIRVKDNGIGLDLERNNLDLFAFYKRFHFHVEGRGLGLFLVKSQVELLGGSIGVESEVETGTSFIVKLRQNLSSSKLSPT